MDLQTTIFFLLGLGLLLGGAELLVKGASRLAAALGLSPLIIGLTVVSFGTSSPELAVSVQSAYAGQADIALGNVVGSNIFNVLFILGLSALIVPLVVAQQLVRWDVPLMIGVSVVTLVLGFDGRIGRLDGALLFGGLVIYTAFAIRQSRKESQAVQAEYAAEYGDPPPQRAGLLRNLLFVAAGLAALVIGSNWLVDGAVALARAFGLSELIIGLTVLAVGTSLPEVATSILAALRKERDIAVGNVVGSNLFNLLGVLGLSSLVSPNGINVPAAAEGFDLPVMIAVAVACLPIFATAHKIARWEGGLFFGYYILYTAYLVLDATEHDALPLFNTTMLAFVLPLTTITLGVLAISALRERRRKNPG